MDLQSEFKTDFSILEILWHKFPVDNSVEVLQIGGSGIAVIDVVGVFPDIDSQKRDVVVGERVASIWCIEDGNVVILFGKPGPSWTEIGNGLGWKVLKELIHATPFVNNQLLEFSFRFSFVGSDAVPIESMIPMLSSIVEYFGVFASK